MSTTKGGGVALGKSDMAELALLDKRFEVLHDFLHGTTWIKPGRFEQIYLLDGTESTLNVLYTLSEVLQARRRNIVNEEFLMEAARLTSHPAYVGPPYLPSPKGRSSLRSLDTSRRTWIASPS